MENQDKLLPSRSTFVGIITAIQEQKQREIAFAKKISEAFVEANEDEDFRGDVAYLPPTNYFIDAILSSLASAFVSEFQTYDEALDIINYYIYDLDLMDYQFVEPDLDPEAESSTKTIPAYYHSKTGLKLQLVTPDNLYNCLIHEMEHQCNN